MMREVNTTVVREKETARFLEASILSAHKKFFEGNLNKPFPLAKNDFMLYNSLIRYFKDSS